MRKTPKEPEKLCAMGTSCSGSRMGEEGESLSSRSWSWTCLTKGNQRPHTTFPFSHVTSKAHRRQPRRRRG